MYLRPVWRRLWVLAPDDVRQREAAHLAVLAHALRITVADLHVLAQEPDVQTRTELARTWRRMARLAARSAAIWVFCLVATTVSAQTHPCDQPDLSTQGTQQSQSGTTFQWQVCAKPADNPTAIVVYVNGVARPDLALTPGTTTTPNANGDVPYLASLNLPKGNYQVQTALTNLDAAGARQEGAKSSPFVYGVVDPIAPPGAPKNVKR